MHKKNGCCSERKNALTKNFAFTLDLEEVNCTVMLIKALVLELKHTSNCVIK